jgi:hypothetical protein
MSDQSQSELFSDPPRFVRPWPALPAWLERRLLRAGEKVTWVRGPRLNPWWERYATHPALFVLALAIGGAFLGAGELAAGFWPKAGMPAVFSVAAAAVVLGSIFVLALSAGYFTRLVVTNQRLVIMQGYETCRSWSIDELPPSLIHYGKWGDEPEGRSVDLEALQTMLGGSSDQFADSRTIRALGKHLEGIKARDKRRPDRDER